DAELRLDGGIGAPVRAREEFFEAQSARQRRRRFTKHEKQNAEDEEDGAPATEPNRPLDDRLGPARHATCNALPHACCPRSLAASCGPGPTRSRCRSRSSVLRET